MKIKVDKILGKIRENDLISGTIVGNLTITENLIVSGTTITENTLNVIDRHITLNSGETWSGVTLNDSGVIIERGLLHDYYIGFYEDADLWRIGMIDIPASMQAIATREDSPLSNGIAVWNSGTSRFDTIQYTTFYTTAETYDRATIDSMTGGSGYTTLLLFYSHTGSTNPHLTSFDDLTSTAHTHNWYNVTNTPITLSGYGITDAINSLSALTDVTISSLSQGQCLIYSGNTWVNKNISSFTLGASSNSTIVTNSYLRGYSNVFTNVTPYVVPFNCKITAMSISNETADIWTGQTRVNGISVYTLSVVAGTSNYQKDLNISVNAGDKISFYCQGTNISRPSITTWFLET